METILYAEQQIIRIKKVDGLGWMVFAQCKCPFAGQFRKAFTFYTKRDAIAFCQQNQG
ncbi:MAG: hypothetical protein KGL39_16800 [Patescibacteria group bacterium]|nr:hypothetical protein [Patescibacteria group bacterium]